MTEKSKKTDKSKSKNKEEYGSKVSRSKESNSKGSSKESSSKVRSKESSSKVSSKESSSKVSSKESSSNVSSKSSSKKDYKMDLKLVEYTQHDEIKRGIIKVQCTGEDCNDQFLNAIGRTAVKRIPFYAFAKELIKIERINPETGYHDSIPFNHDMMRHRIKNTPVMNIDPGIAFLHEKFWRNVDYRDPAREIHENERRVEMYIDAKNTAAEGDTEAILHVTTNDAKIYVDDILTKLYSENYPLLIISLKPKEAFKCSMRAVLGLGITDTCWDACSNFCYDQETIPGSTIINLQAASQFNEFILIDRSLEYFRLRTLSLKEEINRRYLLEENQLKRFQIEIKDEDHTMGEPINYEIQSHPDIMKSSISKPDHLIRTIVLDIEAYKQEKLLNAMMESFDNLLAKIDYFEYLFKQLKRPEITNKVIPGKSSQKSSKETTKKIEESEQEQEPPKVSKKKPVTNTKSKKD